MITPQAAFEKARAASLFTLAPIAYDYFDRWVFDYGGKQEVVAGFWPSTVDKKSGVLGMIDFEDAWDFWKKKKSLPTISVKEISEENKDQ